MVHLNTLFQCVQGNAGLRVVWERENVSQDAAAAGARTMEVERQNNVVDDTGMEVVFRP